MPTATLKNLVVLAGLTIIGTAAFGATQFTVSYPEIVISDDFPVLQWRLLGIVVS